MQLSIRRFPAARFAWLLVLIPALLCAGCVAATMAPTPAAPAGAAPVAAAPANAAPAVQAPAGTDTCLEDAFGGDTNCTSNDVRVSQYILVDGPTECLPGEVIQVKLQAELVAGAQDRYDIGLFIAQDGGDALTGTCFRDYLAPPLKAEGYDPGKAFTSLAEGYTGGGPFLTSEDDEDTCGDISQGEHVFRDVDEKLVDGAYADTGPQSIDVKCQDTVGADGKPGTDGVADVRTCVTWDNQDDASPACTSVTETLPNNKAKCRCSSVPIAGLTVQKVAYLEVKKELVPADDPGKFDLLIDGAAAAEGVGNGGTTGRLEVSAGTQSAPGATYKVSEAAHPGSGTDLGNYDISWACARRGETAVLSSGTGPGPVDVPLEADDDVVCTFTNAAPPTLKLVKALTNDNGGAALETNWTLSAASGSTVLTGPSPVDSAALQTRLKPGTYTLSESFTGDPAVLGAYTAGEWGCEMTEAGTVVPVTNNQVLLGYGEDVTCTITNDDIQPTLTLVKEMDIQYGGTATAGDFQASVTDGKTPVDVEWNTSVDLNAGSYVVSETGPAGYTASGWSGDCAEDGSIALLPGDKKECTITNSDVQPKLKLVKTMDLKYGGTATAADFQASVTDGKNPVDAEWNTFVNLKAGDYVVSETGPAGYAASEWGGDCAKDGKITLAPGDEKTCTITNSDIQPKLKLVKTVDIQYGGTATAADFQASVTDGKTSTNVAWDTFVGFNVGTYDANETGPAGYTASDWAGDCGADGAVALLPGDEKTCTITNADNPATPSGVTAMAWVLHDELIIEDLSPLANSPAKVTFTLFKDKKCEEPWLVEGAPYSEMVPITYDGSTGKAATVKGYTVVDPGEAERYSGKFYWQAAYSGDDGNPGFVTACGHERTAISAATTPADSRMALDLGEMLEAIVRGGIEPKASGSTVMSWVLHDTLKITGIRPLENSEATVTFKLYKDKKCRDPWRVAGASKLPYSETVQITVEDSTGKAATVAGYTTLKPDKFYWQATYSGDKYNEGFTTECGYERTDIQASTTPMNVIPLKSK